MSIDIDLANYPEGSKIVGGHNGSRIRVITPAQQAQRLINQRRILLKELENYTSPEVQYLKDLALKNTSEACVEFFSLYQGSRTSKLRPPGWLSNPTRYLGREHIDVASLGANWFPAMRAWLKHRKMIQGFEAESEPRAALSLLADYLFLYLPWWLELNPQSKLTLPLSPKDFLRHLFVDIDNSSLENVNLPINLLEMIAKRRQGADGRNTVVSNLEVFFNFVITKYEDDPNIAGRKMVNPIRLMFDKTRSKARNKTNKPVFSENIFSQMILFSQGVEAFGEYLMGLAYEKNTFKHKPYGEQYGFNTNEYGYVPIVFFRGKVYPIKWIPNLYQISERIIQSCPKGKAGIYVQGTKINTGNNRIRALQLPSLTAIRMLMGLLETGLRGQGMQWLDIRTWDSDNLIKTPLSKLYTNAPPEMFTTLHVNTDKTKETPWNTLIPWKLRRSFLSEQYFQESLEEEDKHTLCNYAGRDISRFDPIIPLFRSYSHKGPISDNTYSKRWTEFLLGFQDYYNSLNPENEYVRFVDLLPKKIAFGSIDSMREDRKKIFSMLKMSTKFTPHSCRATYATLRDGDFEVSEIAAQLGHTDPITTNYYQVPQESKLRAKLEKFVKKMDVAKALSSNDPEYIHPENKDSSVRVAFDQNRESTLNTFGFIPGVHFWSSEDTVDEETDAMFLLINSPANVIKWHSTHVCPVGNHCPIDVVEKIGGYQRCGLCNLAAKCVDHLPAIAAKKNELVERIQIFSKRIDKLEKVNTQESINQIDRLYKEQELDAREYTGWALSEEILIRKLENMRTVGSDESSYHIESPEIVKRHLEIVTKNSTTSEFLLQRIEDSNAYPSLESAEIRAKSTFLIRKLLARNNQVDLSLELQIESGDEIKTFMGLVKPFAEANGLPMSEIVESLEQRIDSISSNQNHGLLPVQRSK